MVREHEGFASALLILDGWAASYNVLADGSRQFSAVHIPGDLVNSVTPLPTSDVGVTTLTPCRVAFVDQRSLGQIATKEPELKQVFSKLSAERAAILRAWVANIGRREGHDRVAHFMCEMHERMSAVQLVRQVGSRGVEFQFSLTQEELAEAAGMTHVHVNRILQRLRSDGLIEFSNRTLIIHSVVALQQIAEFSPSYLEGCGRRVSDEQSVFPWGNSQTGRPSPMQVPLAGRVF